MTEEGQAVDATAVEEIEDYKPSATDLVVSDVNDEGEIFRVLDRHDEAQILEELQGRALEVMLYSFTQAGHKVTDLSYAGVQEVVRTLNARGATRIRVVADPAPIFDEVVDEGETFIQCTAYAEDVLNGGGAWGTATEPKYIGKGEKRKLDSFARTKALSKSQRNAEKALIPEEFRQVLIAMYLKDDKKIKQIQAGAGAVAEAEIPPPLTTPEAEERKKRARAVYDEIKELEKEQTGRIQFLPGQFFQRFIRAASSLETLDSFIEALEQKRDELKERTTA